MKTFTCSILNLILLVMFGFANIFVTSGYDSSEVSLSACNSFCPRSERGCMDCCMDLGFKGSFSSCRSSRCLCRNVSPYEIYELADEEAVNTNDEYVDKRLEYDTVPVKNHFSGNNIFGNYPSERHHVGNIHNGNNHISSGNGCDRYCSNEPEECTICCRNGGHNPKNSECQGSQCICGTWN